MFPILSYMLLLTIQHTYLCSEEQYMNQLTLFTAATETPARLLAEWRVGGAEGTRGSWANNERTWTQCRKYIFFLFQLHVLSELDRTFCKMKAESFLTCIWNSWYPDNFLSGYSNCFYENIFMSLTSTYW